MSVNLHIDGKSIDAAEGQTVLQAARAGGIYIPTLCDFPGLPSHGSCRMCIVEVQGRPNTPTACTTPVEDGMVVTTDSENLRALRGDVLRMLLADHPAACLFCPENSNCEECMVTIHKAGVTTGCRSCPADGQCTLQEIVRKSGLDKTAYPVRYRALQIEKEDPFFDRDYNLCVLCGRCVRACETRHFSPVPTQVRRGSETRIGTNFGLSHLEAGCSFCGACVDVCPTGALWEKTNKYDGVPDGEAASACPFCSLACDIHLAHKDGMVIGALPATDSGGLCVKGRFGVPETVNHPDRLKQAFQLEDGRATRIGMEEAVQLAAQKLAGCQPDEFALAVSADCGSEELYAAALFATRAMADAPAWLVSSLPTGEQGEAAARLVKTSRPAAEIDSADLVFCLGLDLKYRQSVLETQLMRARERGAKLITLNAGEHIPGRFADLWLCPPAGEEAPWLDALAEEKPENDKIVRAQAMLKEARRPVLLVGSDFLRLFPEEVERLQAATGAAVIALPADGNLTGVTRVDPSGKAAGPQPRVLLLAGAAIPDELKPETYIIYLNTHTPRTPIQNGLILPAAAFSEMAGSLTSQDGRVKLREAAVSPPGAALPGWEILARIAREMGRSGFDFTGAEEIRAAMSADPPVLDGLTATPAWLPRPAEDDFMGAPLADWVEGLRDLTLEQVREAQYVPGA